MIKDTCDIPQQDYKDVAYSIAKGAVSSIPGFGGVAAELLSLYFVAPLQKRKEDWLEKLGTDIEGLRSSQANLQPEALASNERFTTALVLAMQAALATEIEGKRGLLRIAVINSAIDLPPEEDIHRFVEFIKAMSALHVKLLRICHNPKTYCTEHNIEIQNVLIGSKSVLFHSCMKNISDNDIVSLLKDLHLWGLVRSYEINTMITEQGIYGATTTERGDKFLRFITQK